MCRVYAPSSPLCLVYKLLHFELSPPSCRALHISVFQVAGTAVLAHTAVVAVIYCPPLLSLACSGAAWASGAWSSLVASILSPRNGDCSWFDCVGDGAGGGSGGAGEGGGYSGEVSSDNWGWCPVEDDVFWASDGGAAEGVGGGMCRKLEW